MFVENSACAAPVLEASLIWGVDLCRGWLYFTMRSTLFLGSSLLLLTYSIYFTVRFDLFWTPFDKHTVNFPPFLTVSHRPDSDSNLPCVTCIKFNNTYHVIVGGVSK